MGTDRYHEAQQEAQSNYPRVVAELARAKDEILQLKKQLEQRPDHFGHVDHDVPQQPSLEAYARLLPASALEILKAFAIGVSKHERMGIVRILEATALDWHRGQRKKVAGCIKDVRVLARMLAKL